MMDCYNYAEIVLDEASVRFAPLFRENRESKKVFRQYCSILDDLAHEFNGESFEFEVDEETMTISVTLVCPDKVLQYNSHRFYELAARALSVRFSVSEGKLAVTFEFPSLWVRV